MGNSHKTAMHEGQTISHYKVMERLGNGAMGIVCKAEDLRLNRFVALKYLAPSTMADAGLKQRLLQEARAASVLDHPNICRIHEIEELPDGQIVLVMAYYDGETLAARIARGPLNLTAAMQFASQLLSGLNHAHEYGIIHRDIKPSNLMISRNSELKIVDFGLAKRPYLEQALTEPGVVVGTLSYMSPEQILGKDIDHRVDLWASGVVFYEMLCGKLPFSGESPYTVFEAVIRSKPKSILEHRPELSHAVQMVLERSLAKDLTHRYQNAAEFLAALRSLANAEFEPTRSVQMMPELFDRNEVDKNEKSVLVLPFTCLEANEDGDYFCDGLTDEIITDLSTVSSLRVICRTSAMRLKGTSDSAQKIARELKVRYVLEGTVRLGSKSQTHSQSIRVTAKLIDPLNDSLLWAEKYSGSMEDVFAIQENISRQIVAALKVQLTPLEVKQIVARPIPDIHAYQYYLKAKHEILNYSRESLDRALEYLQMGERLVGKNGLLLSAKGQVYWQYVNAGISSDPEYLVKAKDCADQALKLDPESAHAFRLLGLISVQEGKAQEAVRYLKRSIAADPNDSDSLSWYSAVCGFSGKAHAAMPIGKRILEIDPLTPVYRFIPGLLSLMGGEFADAVPSFDDAIKLDPTNSMLLWCRGQALALDRRKSEALMQFSSLEKEHPDHFFAQLARLMSAAMTEDREAFNKNATDELKQIIGCDPHYSWYMAECFSLLGDTASALDWMATAMDKGFINYPMISRWDPLLENLRRAPEFRQLLPQVRERWENFEV